MMTVRKSLDRGHANHGWLDSYHTFSFGSYYDAAHMGVSSLRVINEDRIAPEGGFAPHDHHDMEIISYVLEGALEHQDSMGNRSIIRPGEVQRMSAGTGITHSEFNPSSSESVHFLQIWITPAVTGIAPGYEQTYFTEESKRGKLRLVASSDGAETSLTIHQEVRLYATLIDGNTVLRHHTVPGKRYYTQITRGTLCINDEALQAGDGALLFDEPLIQLSSGNNAEALLFELP